MNGLAIGDLVRLINDGFGGPDFYTRRAGIEPGKVYRIVDMPRDRHRVAWVVLDGVPAPSKKYPGWALSRFERVGAYDDDQ